MPLYDFKCECGHEEKDGYRKLGDTPAIERCPKCGKLSLVREFPLIHTAMQEYHTPIVQYSIAMERLEDIREFQRKAPDVEISDDRKNPLYGVPIVKSRFQKLQALRASGYEEAN